MLYIRSRLVFLFLLFALTAFSGSVFAAAATDIYTFDSPKQQLQFEQLNKQLRCMVCQNESLADSNAPLAQDLRYQVYQMVKQHKSNNEIIGFLLNRYGDYILFEPRITKYTLLLWFGPFVILVLALLRLFWLIRQRNKKRISTFSKEEKYRIKHLLSEH